MRPEPVQTPAHSKGMVLIMTMLMISLLSLLASGAVLRAATNLREGGAQRVNLASYRVSEVGTYAAVALASQMQAGFREYLANTNPPGVLTMADMGGTVLDLTETGSFGRELREIGNPNFQSVVTATDQSTAVPGYDAARYCFTTFRIETTAQIGVVNPTTQQQAAVSGQSAIAAHVTVGPALCGG